MDIERSYFQEMQRFLKETLGRPRRLMGLSFFTLSRIPIITASLAHGHGFAYVAPFIVWGLGDLIFSFSRPNISEK